MNYTNRIYSTKYLLIYETYDIWNIYITFVCLFICTLNPQPTRSSPIFPSIYLSSIHFVSTPAYRKCQSISLHRTNLSITYINKLQTFWYKSMHCLATIYYILILFPHWITLTDEYVITITPIHITVIQWMSVLSNPWYLTL